MNNNVLEIRNMSFAYDDNSQVFSSFDLDVKEGDTIGIIGANGTGKSTLLKIIVGLLGHDGQVKVYGEEVDKEHLPNIRKHLGFVFQDSNNQLFMPTLYDDISFGPYNLGLSEEEVDQRVDEALDRVGISYLKNRHNHKMSGGEKKLASIATILAMKPQIILLDEPTVALDPYNRRNLINILNGINETKIIASHDLDMVLETCDRVVLIDKKGIVKSGDAYEVLSNEELLCDCHLELPLCMQKANRKGE